jgi:hypothetical protein
MGVTGDHYTAEYEGHTIELVRDNWIKKLMLLIDGSEVASASVMFPGDRVLNATLDHNGAQHTVQGISLNKFPFTHDSITVDGKQLTVNKSK